MNRAAIAIFCAVAASLATGGTASAGDGNVLRVIQESPDGSVAGNSLFVDQTGAFDSLVSGPSEGMRSNALTQALEPGYLTPTGNDTNRAALQTGERNTASITMTGVGGELQILQDNSGPSGSALGNTAKVKAFGNDTLGAVLQLGDGNQAFLTLAESSTGLIVQNGLGNEGSLEVKSNGSGKLVQNGNGNYYPVTVDPNTTVTVTQNGNGLQPSNVGLQVFSTNPGTISITQTGY